MSTERITLRQRVWAFLCREGRLFFTLNRAPGHWLLPLASSLAIGCPVLAGAWTQQLQAGLTASLGGLVFLYLPATAIAHRLRSLGMSAGVMLLGYALGMLSASGLATQAPGLALLTAIVTLYCRVFALGGPPGSLFFTIAAAIGASSPIAGADGLHKLMLVASGCLWALCMALGYSLLTRSRPCAPTIRPSVAACRHHLSTAMGIGAVVGLSLALAQRLHLDNPYWVPVSCLAVIQGGSLRDIWNKQLHRMVGTSLGMVWVSFLAGARPDSEWQIAGWIFLLSFAVELTVARHYATGVMFITPMTVLLADSGQAFQGPLWSLAQARLVDTLLGCVLGLLGGVWLHRRAAGLT